MEQHRKINEMLVPEGREMHIPYDRSLRVAIGIPSSDFVHANFAMALAQLCTAMNRVVEFIFINTKGSIIAKNRNKLAAVALEHDADYLLMIDSDMSFPPNSLLQLLHAGKHVCGCTYVARQEPHQNHAVPLGALYGETTTVEVPDIGVVEVAKLPTGLMLIHTDVFKKMPKPFFHFGLTEGDDPQITGEDFNFCDKVRAAGFKVFLEVGLSINVIHWGETGFKISTTPSLPGEFNLGYERVEVGN